MCLLGIAARDRTYLYCVDDKDSGRCFTNRNQLTDQERSCGFLINEHPTY